MIITIFGTDGTNSSFSVKDEFLKQDDLEAGTLVFPE